MKKTILLAMIALGSVLVASCSSDDNSEKNKKDDIEKNHEALLGKWKEISIRYLDQNDQQIHSEFLSEEPCGFNHLSISKAFMEENKKTIKNDECETKITEFEYEIKDNKIQVVGNNRSNLKIEMNYLEDNRLALTYTSNDIDYAEFKGELPKGTKKIRISYQR